MSDAKASIREALAFLMGKFPYQSITVQAICLTAGVSRKTFTRHFASKDDVVLSQLRIDWLDPINSLLDLLPADALKSSGMMLLERNYQALYDHRGYYLSVVSDRGVAWLMEALEKASDELGARPYTENELPDNEFSFAMSFFSGVSANAIKWWINDDFKTSPHELAELVYAWGYAHLREIAADTHSDSRST